MVEVEKQRPNMSEGDEKSLGEDRVAEESLDHLIILLVTQLR